MAGAPHTPDVGPLPGPAAAPADLLDRIVATVVLACDVVFGTTCVVLALLGSWLLIAGEAGGLTVAALWSIPLLNAVWSALTRHHDRVRADLLRGAVCLPITTFLYVAESGVLGRLWVPALTMAVGISLSIGVASRRVTFSYLVTLAYGGALLAAELLYFGTWELALRGPLGLVVTGLVISVVASRLGRSLDEARRQRDGARAQQDRAESALQQLTERTGELTVAIDSLHQEMQRRMRVELELRQAQKLESIGRLAAGVAHEINTPVQFVNDSIQFVRAAVTDLFELVGKLELVQRAVVAGAPTQAAACAAADAIDAADLPACRTTSRARSTAPARASTGSPRSSAR